MTETWTLIGGLRYTEDHKDFEQRLLTFFAASPVGQSQNADFNRIPGAAFVGNGGFGIGSENFTSGGMPLPIDSNFDLTADSNLPPAAG